DIATDSKGNVFVVGQIGSTTSFGCDTHTVAGGRDAYIVKFASDGHCLWSKSFGAGAESASVFATGIVLTPSGGAIIEGFFDSVVDFGGGPLYSQGGSDVYLAKFTGDGKPVWSHRYGTGAYEWAGDVAVDGLGAIYFAGHYDGQSDFGKGPLPVFGFNDFF